MASITLSVTEEMKSELKSFVWVNWSEIAREEAIKKIIFENYLRAGALSDEEWAICDKIGWHPVDELPLKEEFQKELERRRKEKPLKVKSVGDMFK